MTKSESMAKKKLARRVKRESGLSNRKKVGLGWESTCKISRTGFDPRTNKEAKAHQVKFTKKEKGGEPK